MLSNSLPQLLASDGSGRKYFGPPAIPLAARIWVCGGESFLDKERVFAALDKVYYRRHVWVLTRTSKAGAERLAGEWAFRKGVQQYVFEHDSRRNASTRSNWRDWILAEQRPNLVVRFPGGDDTARIAKHAKDVGVSVWEPYPRLSYTPSFNGG